MFSFLALVLVLRWQRPCSLPPALPRPLVHSPSRPREQLPLPHRRSITLLHALLSLPLIFWSDLDIVTLLLLSGFSSPTAIGVIVGRNISYLLFDGSNLRATSAHRPYVRYNIFTAPSRDNIRSWASNTLSWGFEGCLSWLWCTQNRLIALGS